MIQKIGTKEVNILKFKFLGQTYNQGKKYMGIWRIQPSSEILESGDNADKSLIR